MPGLAQPEIEGIPIGSTFDRSARDRVPQRRRKVGHRPAAWLDRLRGCGGTSSGRAAAKRPADKTRANPGDIQIRGGTLRTSDPAGNPSTCAPNRCTLLYRDPAILDVCPSETNSVDWMRAIPHDRDRWLPAFRRCWPQWRSSLRSLVNRPTATRRGGAMGLNLLVNSQLAVGSMELLEECRPAAVVTDHDRAPSPVVPRAGGERPGNTDLHAPARGPG